MPFLKEVLMVSSSIRRENNVFDIATELVNVIIVKNGKRLWKILLLA